MPASSSVSDPRCGSPSPRSKRPSRPRRTSGTSTTATTCRARSAALSASSGTRSRPSTPRGNGARAPLHLARQLVAEDRLEDRDVRGEALPDGGAVPRAERLAERYRLPHPRPPTVPLLDPHVPEPAGDRLRMRAERREEQRVRELVGLEVQADLDRALAHAASTRNGGRGCRTPTSPASRGSGAAPRRA